MLLKSLNLSGVVWNYPDINGIGWICMDLDLYGNVWNCPDVDGMGWICMELGGIDQIELSIFLYVLQARSHLIHRGK